MAQEEETNQTLAGPIDSIAFYNRRIEELKKKFSRDYTCDKNAILNEIKALVRLRGYAQESIREMEH